MLIDYKNGSNLNKVECKYATEYNNVIAQKRSNLNKVECKFHFLC